MASEWESKEVWPDQEFLGWRVVEEAGKERKVEPFLKVRTLHAWRDIGLSFTEWVFNRRGWLTIIEIALLLIFGAAVVEKAGSLLIYGAVGIMVGIYLAGFLGWLFSQRDYAGIVVSQTEGYRTYVDASFHEDEDGIGTLSYVESKVTELDIRKCPRHIINQGRQKPSMRGIQMINTVKLNFGPSEWYMASWQDQTHHIFIGSKSSLSFVAFLAAVTTLDRKVLSLNRHYEKIVKKAKDAFTKARLENSAMTDEEVERAAKDGKIKGKKLPKYMDLLEMDRILMSHINEVAADIDRIEPIISANPIKMDMSRLTKYTKTFVIAAATANLQNELRGSREGVVPLETMRDTYNVAQEVMAFWKTMPGREERLKRAVYSQLYAVVEDIFGVGAEKIKQGQDLLKKRRDETIGRLPEKENASLFEVKE